MAPGTVMHGRITVPLHAHPSLGAQWVFIEQRRHLTNPGPYFRCEEIGRYQHIHMTADELRPGRLLLAIADRGQPVSLQDIGNRCITYPVPKILQGAANPVISPRLVLSRKSQYTRFNFPG